MMMRRCPLREGRRRPNETKRGGPQGWLELPRTRDDCIAMRTSEREVRSGSPRP
jgi:hypothetical protein